MAPEQARDASTVDIRADIYGLGGTLFWCLTGAGAFPRRAAANWRCWSSAMTPAAASRCARARPPAGTGAVVRMMALRPDDRYPTPQEVMAGAAAVPAARLALRQGPVAAGPCAGRGWPSRQQGARHAPRAGRSTTSRDPLLLPRCSSRRARCGEAADGAGGAGGGPDLQPDLVLLDVNMPRMSGPRGAGALRAEPPLANLKVIMFSGHGQRPTSWRHDAGRGRRLPLQAVQRPAVLRAGQAALRLKEAQDRSDLLNHAAAVGERRRWRPRPTPAPAGWSRSASALVHGAGPAGATARERRRQPPGAHARQEGQN